MFGISKKVYFWGLYDLGNSLVVGNLTLYFSQWLIIENGVGDIWYGSAIALATILLLMTAPVLGFLADKTHKKMGYILPLSIVFGLGTIGIGILGAGQIPSDIKIFLTVILFIAVQYAYQLSLVFYDTLLASLAKPEEYGRISGLGEGMGNMGQIVGLFLTYPFINGGITLFGEPGRIQAFIPAGAGFLLLASPMLLTFKDTDIIKNHSHQSLRDSLISIKDLLKNRNILWFLVAFYFISDVILTIQIFFPIYFDQVLGFTDYHKIAATILIMAFIILGAIILGKYSDKIGFKKTTSLTTLVLLSLFAIFPFIRNPAIIWIMLPFAGFFWGGFYSASRAFLTKLAPKEKRTEFFSLYTIFRRSASILGPFIWSTTVLAFAHLGTDKYRVSMYPMLLTMLIGVYFLNKVKADTPNQ